MQIDHILMEKQPPPGGLLSLRKRLCEREGKRVRRRRLALATAALLIAVVVAYMILPHRAPRSYQGWFEGNPMPLASLGLQVVDQKEPVQPATPNQAFLPLDTEGPVLIYHLVRR